MQRSGGWRGVLAVAGLVVVVGAGTAAPVAAASPSAPDPGVFGFGNNDYGQLGHGNNVDDQGLGHVIGLPVDVRQIAAGGNTSAALLPDGTVWMWGAALNGMSSGTVPVRGPGLTGITQIAVSQNGGDLFAVGPGGSVLAFGHNTDGQLGNGSRADDFSPAPVPGLTGITQVSAGTYYTLAVRSDGTVWAWGLNGNGELNGSANKTVQLTPEQVPCLSGITQVAFGEGYGLALSTIPAGYVAVPSVIGDTQAQASQDLRAAGLALGTVGSALDPTCDNIGTVLSQRPGAGSYALRGAHVSITIGKFNPRLCS